jgi:hypothetical protein
MEGLKDIISRAAVPVTTAAILGVGALFWTSISTRVSQLFGPPYAQRVSWISEGNRIGMNVWDDKGERGQSFIPWPELNVELQAKLMPLLFKDPSGYRFEAQDYRGKRMHVVKILDPEGKAFGWLWLGSNPDNGWEFDGLVRVGGENRLQKVWQTYQRFSDGSYRRNKSAFGNLEDACPPSDRPCIRE